MTTATKAALPDLHLPAALHIPSLSNQVHTLLIEKIHTDGGTQTRAELNGDVVLDYAERMANGATFPPVDVFFDGKDYWMADGFHRIAAALANGSHKIETLVHQGTRRDAILWSVAANARHGLRRTNADKRRAVETILSDGEWRKWSDSEIARRCEVTVRFVGKVREELSLNSSKIDTRTVTRSGVTYPMRTENIGRATPAPRYGPVDEPEPAVLEPEWQDVIDAEFQPNAPAPSPAAAQMVAQAKALKAEKQDKRPAIPASERVFSTTENETAILQWIMRLYNGNQPFDLDPTYSTGRIYEGLPRPRHKSDLYPQVEGCPKADARHLSFKDGELRSVVFDPPFVAKDVTRENAHLGIIESRFSGYKGMPDLWKFYEEALCEFHRVLRPGGIVVFKCQDGVSGGKQYWSHVFIMNTAAKLGYRVEDLFILFRSNVTWDDHDRQIHARKNHCYYLVLVKEG